MIRFVVALVLGAAGACMIFFGLNHLADYAWTSWRHDGTERAVDLWIFFGSVVAGLALMYPVARFLSERDRKRRGVNDTLDQ